jgi:chromosome segregation ATPase
MTKDEFDYYPATGEEIEAYARCLRAGVLLSATPSVVGSLLARIQALKTEREAYRFSGEQAMGMGTGLHIMEERDELKHKLRKCEQERDALKAELGRMKSRPCESEFSRLDGMWQDLVKERDALTARVRELEAQHKDCLEQKEALREKAEVLELGYRGFP